ncbi:MAG: leucine-rich repeat domain-containing protein, partial [Muribaculaceae bacterium]|nr:leucine-rich repeat domain-containing protein [Muribaculaceae bacterium]
MKKILSLLLFVAMSMPMWGVTYVADNLLYEQVTSPSGSTPGTVKCVGFNKSPSTNTSLTIPYMITVNGYSYYVNTIASSAFEGVSKLTSVRLSYGIKEIESNAFRGCYALNTVRLPSSMEYIYSDAFYGCPGLTSVYFASSTGKLKGYSTSAFPNSTKCKLYIPRTVKSREEPLSQSIWGPDRFVDIQYSDQAYDIYMSDGTMAVVTKPSTSTSVDHECTIIGFNKMGGNTGVAEGIYRPANYRTKPSNQDRYFKYVAVSELAFTYNTDLTQLDLSNLTGITSYGRSMCLKATNLTSVRLAGGKLNGTAFSSCTKLTSVDLGSVTNIGEAEFYDNASLPLLNIPATVTAIDPTFVDLCPALKEINVAAGNPNYESYSSSLYTKGQKELLKVPQAYQFSAYKTSPLCETIADDAFRRVSEIQNIYVTYGCKTIKKAFHYCSALKVVEIPSSVVSLDSYTFFECPALTDLYVNINSNYIPTINKTAFLNYCGNPNLYVQHGNVTAFQSKGWTGFKSYNKDGIVPADYLNGGLGYTVKQAGAVTVNGLKFTGGTCKLVRRTRNSLSGTVNVPGYIYIGSKDYVVDEIADEAFSNTSSFSITGCDYVTTVGTKAFDSQPITSIQLPRVTSIGLNAFDSSTLGTVSWGANLKEIRAYAFRGCPITNDIVLPVGFTSLGDDAFSGVNSKRILVPSTATGIVPRAFYGMSSLTELVLNNNAATKQSMVLTGVPTTCVVRVPVECRDAVKASPSFKNYTVNAGSYDFFRSNPRSAYKMTVTSTAPVTKDGVTYAGTAKYVYNNELKGASAFYAELSETDNVLNSGKKYL